MLNTLINRFPVPTIVSYAPTTNPEFLGTLEDWFRSQNEILIEIRYRRGAGSQDFELFSSFQALSERVRELPPGAPSGSHNFRSGASWTRALSQNAWSTFPTVLSIFWPRRSGACTGGIPFSIVGQASLTPSCVMILRNRAERQWQSDFIPLCLRNPSTSFARLFQTRTEL